MALVAWALGLIVLASVGLVNASYFVAVTYGWIAPDARWIPPVCRMDARTCASIVEAPYARVLGLPNAVYGVAWYALVAGASILGLAWGAIPGCELLWLASVGTVAFSIYLVWALVQRLGVACPLCFLGHGINGAIFILLLGACAVG